MVAVAPPPSSHRQSLPLQTKSWQDADPAGGATV